MHQYCCRIRLWQCQLLVKIARSFGGGVSLWEETNLVSTSNCFRLQSVNTRSCRWLFTSPFSQYYLCADATPRAKFVRLTSREGRFRFNKENSTTLSWPIHSFFRKLYILRMYWWCLIICRCGLGSNCINKNHNRFNNGALILIIIFILCTCFSLLLISLVISRIKLYLQLTLKRTSVNFTT